MFNLKCVNAKRYAEVLASAKEAIEKYKNEHEALIEALKEVSDLTAQVKELKEQLDAYKGK